MFTKLSIKLLNLVLGLLIILILIIPQPSESLEVKGIANWQVHSACKDALEHEDDSVRKTATLYVGFSLTRSMKQTSTIKVLSITL